LRDDLALLRMQLIDRLPQLVQELAPGGFERYGEYNVLNPTGGDSRVGNFKIRMRGVKAGSFVDYAGVNAPFANGGDRGDVIDLIAYCKFGRSRKEAIAWAREYVGSSGNLDKPARLAVARRALAQQEDRSEQARRDRAKRTWRRALPQLSGTLAIKYLREARGIPLDEITSPTRDLRFAPDLKHHHSGLYLPAIIAAMRDQNGDITGVHCTYLAPDGSGKAKVDPQKIMLGKAAGSVIRVANGETLMSPEEAAAAGRKGVLGITEGLEDALSLAAAAPWARIWAAGSLGNIGYAPIDHPCVERVIVAADNDQNPRAIQALERALEQLHDHRKPVVVMRSPIGKDINDAIRGAA
jgi:hypothetical protein